MVVALGGVRECSTSATVMNTHALQERNKLTTATTNNYRKIL